MDTSTGTRLLNQKEAAELLHVSVKTVQRWRHVGCGPHFIRAGLRKVLYAEVDLSAWLNSRRHQSLAAEARAA